MKVVILTGGAGTRISEETQVIPKPMVEIGKKPILWNLMKHYSYYGHDEFYLALGYKQEKIREYFINYHKNYSDIQINTRHDNYIFYNSALEDWTVNLIDTGQDTMTGGRILRLKNYINETFMMTYGDGIGNIDLNALLKFHKSHGKLATVTIIQNKDKFGIMKIKDNGIVTEFNEKKAHDGHYVNIGFFVLEPEVFNYIVNDKTFFEKEPLEKLVQDEQLMAYHHKGFWKNMDTLKDKNEFEQMIQEKNTPWIIW
jgi:glucose-1-phosphate cytidylyltransferase